MPSGLLPSTLPSGGMSLLPVLVAAEGAGEAAFGIVRAADERAELAELQRQLAGAACRALARIDRVAFRVVARREEVWPQHFVDRIDHVGDAQLRRCADGGRELGPEVAEEILPRQLAVGDEVELLFQRGGEIVFHVTREEFLEEDGDQAALVFRDEALLFQLHIIAVDQRRQRRGVGGRPADAEFFQALHQRGFRIARRRFGEVLRVRGVDQLGRVALADRRQAAAILVVALVLAFLIELQEAVELDDLARGAQHGAAIVGRDFDGGALDRARLPSARRQRASRPARRAAPCRAPSTPRRGGG